MEPRLLPKYGIGLFIIIWVGAMLCLYGFTHDNIGVKITGLVVTAAGGMVAIGIAVYDEYMGDK